MYVQSIHLSTHLSSISNNFVMLRYVTDMMFTKTLWTPRDQQSCWALSLKNLETDQWSFHFAGPKHTQKRKVIDWAFLFHG